MNAARDKIYELRQCQKRQTSYVFFSSFLVTRFYTLIGTQNHVCIYDMEVKVKQSWGTKGTIGRGGVRTGKVVVSGRKTLSL